MAVRLSVRDLKPGMVVAEPIAGKNGQGDLPAGTTLTVQHITAMTGRTDSAVVAEDPEGTGSSSTAERRGLAIEHVEKRMRWKPCTPFEEEIYQVAVEQAERLLMEEKEK